MREKLLQLMKDEGLTSSRLAEILEIQPSGISHLLSGRNKPGFELLQKMLRRFPRINPDWLLLDSDQMYRDTDQMSTRVSASVIPQNDLFARQQPTAPTKRPDDRSSGPTDTPSAVLPPVTIAEPTRNDVERVVIIYADHTCESFVTKNRK